MYAYMVCYCLLTLSFRSKNLLCKKASISLGIRFDDSKYAELKKHLKTIGKAKELVSYEFAIERLILNYNISKGNKMFAYYVNALNKSFKILFKTSYFIVKIRLC